MNTPLHEPQVEFHPAHWAAITDQRDRMMDVRSVLACVRCALLSDETIEVFGAVCIAHDVLDDIIDQLDSASLDKATTKWLAERHKVAKND
jgi:hypothetical protein